MTFYEEMGMTKTIAYTINPSNATYKLQWTSSNPAVASVSSDGQVTAWAEGTAVITLKDVESGVSASCNVKVKTYYSDAKSGQYIYADGSYGSDATNAIAKIIWTGDPTAHDAELKKDHPACIHGLAVAMNHYGPSINYGTVTYTQNDQLAGLPVNLFDTSRYLGYFNTKHIKDNYYSQGKVANKSCPVFDGLSSHTPAPARTSGWYIPSVAEVRLVKQVDSGYMNMVAGSSSSGHCWTSSLISGSVFPAAYKVSVEPGYAEKFQEPDKKLPYFYIFAF
jgi:hypothetical protein